VKLKYYLMLLFLGVIALFYFRVNPSQVVFLLKCPLYKSTGVFCPGCGSQRAFHHLLHGDILIALQNNLMLVLGTISLVYHYLIQLFNHLFKKKFKSVFDNKKVILIAVALLILFWVLRNIPIYPFSLLTPTN